MIAWIIAHIAVVAIAVLIAGAFGKSMSGAFSHGLPWRQRIRDFLSVLFWQLVAWPIACSILVGISVIGWQCLRWLKFAAWPEMTINVAMYEMIERPIFSQTGWLGIDRFLQWLLDSVPLTLWLIVIFPLIWLGVAIWVGNRFSQIGNAKTQLSI
jgi:hypothetical protein